MEIYRDAVGKKDYDA